jgi:hypothetical protein
MGFPHQIVPSAVSLPASIRLEEGPLGEIFTFNVGEAPAGKEFGNPKIVALKELFELIIQDFGM